MSDTKNGPLAAILAEMRDGIHTGRADIIDCVNDRLRSYADRIEAAAEQEAIDAELKWRRIGYDERKAEEKPSPGNTVAMRAALTSFVDSIQWLCDGDERGLFKRQFAPLLSEARAALAAPARNVDRPECRTRDEAWKVFERESAGMWAADWDAAFMAWLFYAAQDEGGSK